jgi:hypothetical protein
LIHGLAWAAASLYSCSLVNIRASAEKELLMSPPKAWWYPKQCLLFCQWLRPRWRSPTGWVEEWRRTVTGSVGVMMALDSFQE